jgi:hypothetical protein
MDDSTIFTWIPNAYSRWSPETKRLDIDWLPLHRNQKNELVHVVFPSSTLFGTKTLLQHLARQWTLEFSMLPLSLWPWISVHLGFRCLGIQL